MAGRMRIAVNAGSGYVQGLNAAVAGVVLAADRIGWETVAIRDGYDGLLHADGYPDGGLVRLDAGQVPMLLAAEAGMPGTAARIDPFHARCVNADGLVEEIDRSDELIRLLRNAGIDAVVSIVGGSALTGANALGVAFKLARKGLPTVCIPKSIENDFATTALSLGFNSALAQAVETLVRLRAAAQDVRRLAVVELAGQHAGWLALQAGVAACADAVLIPEIPYDLASVAADLRGGVARGRRPALVVVAEGATAIDDGAAATDDGGTMAAMRKSLSPLSDPRLGEGARVIARTGRVAHAVALALQELTDIETLPFAPGQLLRAGALSAVDRQLGIGLGAGAVRAIDTGRTGVLVGFQPPDVTFAPLAEALNAIRAIPKDSEFIRIARAIGISLGERGHA